MSLWLDDFLQSGTLQRIVYGDYMSHVREHQAFNGSQRGKYATVEEALEDFAKRTGLTSLQKRALRREIFVKTALDYADISRQKDLQNIERGEAPAALLPGVGSGTDTEKQLRQQLKKKRLSKDKKNMDFQGDDYVDSHVGNQELTGDDDSQLADPTMANLKPGFTIIAVDDDDDMMSLLEEETPKEEKEEAPSEQISLVGLPPKKKRQGPRRAPITTKEKKLRRKLERLEEAKASYEDKHGNLIDDDKWEAHEQLIGDIEEVKAELAEVVWKREQKDRSELPSRKVEENNLAFLREFEQKLGLHRRQDEKRDEFINRRNEKIRELSNTGLQKTFDETLEDFRKKLYYRPSQGYSEEHGDYVKDMAADAQGKTWINYDDPSRLPFSRLVKHEDLLLGGVDLTEAGTAGYRKELVQAYLRKFPGAVLQSREQELSSFMEKVVDNARGHSVINPPHIATETDRSKDHTDEVVLDDILYQLRRFGIDPPEKPLDELASEILHEIKTDIDMELPGKIEDLKGEYGPIGVLEDKDISWEVYARIFNDNIQDVADEYRGSRLRWKAPTRRQKLRWTGTQRRQRLKQMEKQLEREDIVRELGNKLGKPPSEKQIREEMRKRNMVPLYLSILKKGCWNCDDNTLIYADNTPMGRDSVECPNCGVYREIAARNFTPDKKRAAGLKKKAEEQSTGWWECGGCGKRKNYVIRDLNENDPGGLKVYRIYCDEDYLGNGPKVNIAENSQYVFALTRSEQEVLTTIPSDEGDQEGEGGLEVGTQVYSDQLGYARVVWIEDEHIWVETEDESKARTVTMKDLQGEVIYIGSKYPQQDGWHKVLDIQINRDAGTLTVIAQHHSGRTNRPQYGLGDADMEVEVATSVPKGELKLIQQAGRRHRRTRLLEKLADHKCSYAEWFEVERYTKKESKKLPIRPVTPEGEEEDLGETIELITYLRRRVKRGSILKRLVKHD